MVKSIIITVLSNVAGGTMTINQAAEALGVGRIGHGRFYDQRMRPEPETQPQVAKTGYEKLIQDALDGVECKKLSINDAREMLGMPRICAGHCNVCPAAAPELPAKPAKPDVYVMERGGIEITFLSGDFAGTTIAYRPNTTGRPFSTEAFHSILCAYAPRNVRLQVAYDPWVGSNVRSVLAAWGAEKMTPSVLQGV